MLREVFAKGNSESSLCLGVEIPVSRAWAALQSSVEWTRTDLDKKRGGGYFSIQPVTKRKRGETRE